MRPSFSSTTLWKLKPAWKFRPFFMRIHSGSVVFKDSSSWSSFRMFFTLDLSIFWSFNSSSMVTKEPNPSSASSTVSHWVRISLMFLSICFKAFWALFLVQVLPIEALALILLPSKKRVLPSIRFNLIHILAHCFKVWAKASLFFLRNSAIVLWSGFNPEVSQIKERLWWVALSSFRELRIP
jgi:hypothetical protein